MNTLSYCDINDPEYITEQSRTVIMKTVTIDNWPFDLETRMSHTWTNISAQIIKKYDYLKNASLFLPALCLGSRGQMTVIVKVSTCEKQRGYYRQRFGNNIPALSDDCLASAYNFNPVGNANVTMNIYHDFIYRENGYINNEYDIWMRYSKCPAKCRHYKYSTFIKKVDGTTIFEFTSSVGDVTFTGGHHRGFRVTLLKSNTSCDKDRTCALSLHIQKPLKYTRTDLNGTGIQLVHNKT